MRTTSWIVAAAAAGLVSLAVGSAGAAPLASNHADVKASAKDASAVESVSYRCWWHRGHRHCRYVEPSYSYRYYAPRPVFSFYYGPRYRRWY